MHRPARLAVDDFILLAQVPNAVVIVRNERGETVWTSPYSVKDLMDDATVPPLARAVDCLSSEVASVVEAMVARTRERQETLEYLQMIRGRCCFTRLVPLTGRDGADCVGIFLMPLLGPVASRWTGVNCVSTPDLGRLGSLSPRELEVVWYLAQGSSVKEVAAAMFRSIKTIENHIASIHRGLGVQSRAELVRDTVERGLTSVDLNTWLKITGVSGGVGTSASLNQPNNSLEQAGR
jgi:DNA-binding CsgD family transcriptional regulator